MNVLSQCSDESLHQRIRYEQKRLTEDFLLRISAYFCRNGTSAEAGSVAASGYNKISNRKKRLLNTV